MPRYSSLRTRFIVCLFGISCAASVSAQSLDSSFDMQTDAAKVKRLFRRFNTAPNRTAELTPEGVDFKIGPGKAAGNVGYDLDAHIVGDFQMEVKYAILTAPDVVSEGYGLMLGLRAKISDKVGDGAMNRGIYVKENGAYHAGRAVPLGSGKRYAGRSFPSKTRSGRMGLRRVGDRLIYLAAETPDGEFLKLTEYPYPADKPVSVVTLYADSGGSEALFEGRLYDFKLMTGASIPADLPDGTAQGKELQTLPTAQEIANANNPKLAAVSTSAIVDEPEDAATSSSPIRGLQWFVGIGIVILLAGGIVIGRFWNQKASPPPPQTPQYKTSRVLAHRVACGHRHHWRSGRAAPPGRAKGTTLRAAYPLLEQPQEHRSGNAKLSRD